MNNVENAYHRGSLARRSTLLVALTLAMLLTLVAGAWAASPGWELLAATGPTHLPPEQSETQRVTVEATGGTFTLSQVASGSGRLSFAKAALAVKENSREATVAGTSNPFEVGQEVRVSSGSRLEIGDEVESVSGKTVTFKTAAKSTGTTSVTATSKTVTGVTGTFHVGETIAGTGVAAGTTITAVNAGAKTLTLSEYPTAAGVVTLSANQTTSALAFDASAEEVQSALDALPSFGAGAFSVTGGPGGDVEHPYFVTFAGGFANSKQSLFVANMAGLEGEHAFVHVFTTIPGGPGTGSIGVYPTNVGGQATSGTITVAVGPLPQGVSIPTASTGNEWSCTSAAPEATAICTSTRVVSALKPDYPVSVPVQVGTGAPVSATIPVSVSGGGAGAPAAYQLPFVVSTEPATAGIAGFWFGAFDEDGELEGQAGGHPYGVANELLFNTVRVANGKVLPAGDVKEVLVDLPPGLSGDPMITSRCPQSLLTEEFTFGPEACNKYEESIGALIPETSFAASSTTFNITNDVPVGGTAAEFSTKFASPVQSLFASVRSEEDFGVRVSAPNVATFDPAYGVFSVFEGMPATANGRAFFANPTDCAEQERDQPVVRIQASTWQHSHTFEQAVAPQTRVTGCDKLEFNPEFSFQPSGTTGSSAVGATAHLHIDQSGLTDPGKLATPDLKESVVRLPEGFDVNPSQANGLAACSEAQVGYVGEGELPNPTRFDDAPVACPEASKLGTVEASSPLLEEPLRGTVYLAAQEENPFHSLIALYLVIESKRFGITLKLPGKVETNPTTGQITATFDYVPQQPVEDLTLHFRGGGGRSEFATPEVCGTYATKGVWTPWSAPQSGPPAQTEDPFTVSTGCSPSPAARPFAPSFQAGTVAPSAGAYSPLVIKLARNDGEQELTRFDVTLPEGLVGRLAGVPKCSDAQIAAASATGRTGRQEVASPSCPAESQIGTLDTTAGVGSEPIHVAGKAYLAGAYEGAPLSVATITPALAGPFDLGVVVVRAPLFIDQSTARVTAKSDPIPTILRGIPLKVRGVTVSVDRPGFSLNPTSCEAMSVTGTATGSSGATHSLSNRFQVGDCSNLGFDPVFSASTQAKASANGNGASLTVDVGFHPGEANIHKVQAQLPKLLPSRLTTLQKACPEHVFNTNPAACPVESNVGMATAITPLLSESLHGPAYLVSHGGAEFPDLELVLQSEGITLILDGKTEIKNGITTSRFETVPDAPVTSFKLELPESPHSALGVPRGSNLCYQPLIMPTLLIGQNGKGIRQNTQIQVVECPYLLKVLKHGVKQQTATLQVYVPQAGKLTTTGAGITKTSKTTTARQTITIKLKQRHPGKFTTKALLRFTPTTGRQRRILHTTVRLSFR